MIEQHLTTKMATTATATNDYPVCRVCSDRASGYNFDILTCEPCKYFFSRNIYRLDELQCPRNNDCPIDRMTRKGCRKCRLVKCFQVGMHRNRIRKLAKQKSLLMCLLSEQSNDCFSFDKPIFPASGQKKGNTNELPKSSNYYDSTEMLQDWDSISSTSHTAESLPSNSSSKSFTQDFSNPLNSYPMQQDISTDSEPVNIQSFSFCASTNKGQFPSQPSLDQTDSMQGSVKSPSCDSPTPVSVIMNGSRLDSCQLSSNKVNVEAKASSDQDIEVMEDSLEEQINPKLQFNSVCEDKNGCQDLSLSLTEIKTIERVVEAFYSFSQPLPRNENVSVETIIQFTDIYLEKLISGCRSLFFFCNMCLDDQITLVKFSFPVILSVEKHFSTLSTAKNEIGDQPKLDTSMIAIDYSLVNHLVKDPKVICVLIAVILYNPDLHNLRNSLTIRKERQLYIKLLRRYLESQCGSPYQARVKLFDLINLTNRLIFTQQQRQFNSNGYYYL
uniref:Hormone receptor 96-1 n=1 Tax=Tetranychus cinnabarinus TaxID=93129 RepID=A0A2P1K4F8_TETCI|nr:hormone receptor 96-1 [Tetranychus cinnabarinus]